MKKRIIAIITTATIALMAAGPVLAITATELQAQINLLMAQLATLQTQLATLQGTTPTVTGCTITSFARNLSQGATGDDVKCLQITLNSAADTQVAASGVGSSGNETTYFGSLTKAGVVKFQDKYASEILTPLGLTAGTGYVGSATRTKLNTMLGAPTTPTTPTTPTPPAAGLSVALASDNPAAAAIVSDSVAGDGAQALIPMLKLNFTASSEGDAKVTTIKIKRAGISADTDVANAYLADSDGVIAELASIASGVITFSDSAGLFTISAGSTKAITVKFDLGEATSSGKTINFSLNAVSDVVTNASSVNGTFPITGSTMSTAQVTDLGNIDVANQTTPASVNSGETNRELWQVKLTVGNQKVRIDKIVLTMIGTSEHTAFQDVKLMVGTDQLGATIASVPSSKVLTFDLSSSPYTINSGEVKYLSVRANVIGGAGRNVYFSFQKSYHLMAYDKEYGIYLKPNQSNAWTAVNGDSNTSTTAVDATSINAGTLTVSRSTSSPTGKIATGALNIVLGMFDFKATGEAVKISSLQVGVDTDDDEGLDDVRLYVDGSQIGTTSDVPTGSTYTDALELAGVDFSFGNAFIIPAGTTKTLEVKANGKNAAETNFGNADTIKIKLVLDSNNAIGQSSSTQISTPAVDANTLTVSSGTIVVSKNLSVADGSSTVPTAVKGANNVKIASFVITAPTGEAVDVTQIVVGDELDDGAGADDSLADSLYNLRIMHGTTQIGSTQGTLTDTLGTDYTFTPTSAIRIEKAAQYVVDIYADTLSSGVVTDLNADTDDGPIECVSVTATGVTTGSDASDTSTIDIVLQDVYIATSGNLTITKAGSTPITQSLTTGSTDVELAKFQFESDNSEDITVTKVIITDDGSSATVLGGLTNVRLFDGITQVGAANYSWTTSDATNDGYMAFDSLSWTIGKGKTKTLTVKADLSTWNGSAADSAATHQLSIEDDYSTAASAQEGVEATGAQSSASITTTALDFSANTDADVDANLMRINRAKLVVATASASPTGTGLIGRTDQSVGIFTLTNESPDGYTITVSDIDVYPMSTNITLTTGTARYIKVYVDAANASGLKTYDTYLTNDSTTEWTEFLGCADTDNTIGKGCTEGSTTSFTITAGTSRVLYVTADTDEGTHDSNGADSFQMKFIAGTDTDSDGIVESTETISGFTWSDGDATIYDADALPVNGNSMGY